MIWKTFGSMELIISSFHIAIELTVADLSFLAPLKTSTSSLIQIPRILFSINIEVLFRQLLMLHAKTVDMV